jgi:hypothetical protein
MKPAVHRLPGTVSHRVKQSTALQVQQAGHLPRGRLRGRGEKPGSSSPSAATLQAGRVVHQRAAVVAHGPHAGRPADAEVAGDRRHGWGVLTDPPGGLRPSPPGHHRPRTNRDHPLGPGSHTAGRLAATGTGRTLTDNTIVAVSGGAVRLLRRRSCSELRLGKRSHRGGSARSALPVSFAVAARLLPDKGIWDSPGLAEATRQAGDQGCGGVEVRGFEPLASSVRGRRSAGLSYTPSERLDGTRRLQALPWSA